MSLDLIPDGIYKAKAAKDGHQFSENEKTGTLELILDMNVKISDGDEKTPAVFERAQTFLFFSGPAAPYSVERLRACGCKGDDVSDLTGIDTNVVDVQVKTEMYEGAPKKRMQIISGGGRFETKKPVDPKLFAARVKAIMGGNTGPNSGPGPTPPSSAVKPPF